MSFLTKTPCFHVEVWRGPGPESQVHRTRMRGYVMFVAELSSSELASLLYPYLNKPFEYATIGGSGDRNVGSGGCSSGGESSSVGGATRSGSGLADR